MEVFIDTNVFISAAKSGITKSTALVFKLCFDDSIELVGNILIVKSRMEVVELAESIDVQTVHPGGRIRRPISRSYVF